MAKINITKSLSGSLSETYLKLNGDRGSHWWGKLSNVRLRERNISTPFCFPLDEPKKI